MRKLILGATAALGVALAVPAAAQGIQIGPGGVRVDPGIDGVGRREAVRIARSEGLTDVDDVSRRGPRWFVEGSDRRGRDLTVVVDGRSGDVIDVRRGY
jgi:hypothetical protein